MKLALYHFPIIYNFELAPIFLENLWAPCLMCIGRYFVKRKKRVEMWS